MEIQNILSELTQRFGGGSFNIAAVTEHLKGIDTSKFSMDEIIAKVKGSGLIGDLDGDGVQESAFEEIKGKLGSLFGGK
ncbi:MAG: hypothetical protein NC187_10190 [Candidatus Amulumruptor caecigallinarius]|nr:hypothetical protein [Candidatus Amulumruptor caecigallinarius]MCM1397834.1 hypothetical protein [Candidatus Amulumruptor caecigallinarius]MCM1454893.1 hypothetical protein [bacterium]